MNSNNGESGRLITNTIELRRRVAAVAEDIDYEERTGFVPDPQMRAWVARLDRIVDGLDEHQDILECLVD